MNMNVLGGHRSPAVPVNDMDVDNFLVSLIHWIDDSRLGTGGSSWIEETRAALADFVESSNYRDLLRASHDRYIEVQMFGPLDLSDVKAIEVESLAHSRALRRALDKAGHEDIVIRAARDHSRLYAIRNGMDGAVDSLSPDDIDALGDYYIEWVFKRTYGDLRPRTLQTTTWPDTVSPWVHRLRDGEPFTVEQKREALTAWYEELAKGPDSRLPYYVVRAYRKSKAGFTDDMMDQTLLEGPVEGNFTY